MEKIFLSSAKNQFEYYKLLGEKTFSQVSDAQLFWQMHTESNSIAIIVNHLWGNMLSRWTDFLNTDGEKTWRDRDAEFETEIPDRDMLITKWNAGWTCLFDALNALEPEDFEKKIMIRNEEHSIVEAINRQLAHYAYHIGQIVFIGKLLNETSWHSLSIPKGNSKVYNAEKFSNPK